MTTVTVRRVPMAKELGLMAGDIKLAHSVFALPFALLGAFLARSAPSGWGRFAGQLALVVACMVLARTWAMLVNRLVDRRLDADNARTKGRVFASGNVHPAVGWVAAFVCAGLFVAAAALFRVFYANQWPLLLALPTLAWLAFYSWTKRFTALCHLVLGVSLALSPIAAAVAVRPAALGATPALWWLAGFVALWVAGFDIIYALQDETFDRERKLRSVPTALGTRGAIGVARAAHVGCLVALAAAWTSDERLGALFGIGGVAVIALLAVEHAALTIRARRDRPGLHAAFFTLNGVIALVLGAAGIADILA